MTGIKKEESTSESSKQHKGMVSVSRNRSLAPHIKKSKPSNDDKGTQLACSIAMDYDRICAQARRRMPAWTTSRRAQRLLVRALVVAAVVPLVVQVLVGYVIGADGRLLPFALQRAASLLVVTAHPDDECLFFAPSIVGVLDRNREVVGGLLVFSTG
jgi:hypothetical protein